VVLTIARCPPFFCLTFHPTSSPAARAGWWLETVQLDLEAKGILARFKTSPLRLHRL
jgi:hypothetical protein